MLRPDRLSWASRWEARELVRRPGPLPVRRGWMIPAPRPQPAFAAQDFAASVSAVAAPPRSLPEQTLHRYSMGLQMSAQTGLPQLWAPRLNPPPTNRPRLKCLCG